MLTITIHKWKIITLTFNSLTFNTWHQREKGDV